MASAAGMVRDFKATTTASTSDDSGAEGTPKVCITRMPERTKLLARSVAPVKSSAMQPNFMWKAFRVFKLYCEGFIWLYFALGNSMPGKILITALSSSLAKPAVLACMNI